MDAYYDEQIFSPQYFGGPSRQLGSGGLAFRVARVTLPLVKKYIWPVAKRLGRELITQAVPEVVSVFSKKKSGRQAIKDAGLRALSNTAKRTLLRSSSKKTTTNDNSTQRRRARPQTASTASGGRNPQRGQFIGLANSSRSTAVSTKAKRKRRPSSNKNISSKKSRQDFFQSIKYDDN